MGGTEDKFTVASKAGVQYEINRKGGTYSASKLPNWKMLKPLEVEEHPCCCNRGDREPISERY